MLKSRGFGNLYLGASFADLAKQGKAEVSLFNFGRSQTSSLVSRPKFAKNKKTSTATTSIVFNADSYHILSYWAQSAKYPNHANLKDKQNQ